MPSKEAQTLPLITIGLTCFNAADTIIRALESARAQDYPNTEIILIDDGSTDSSIEMIENYIGHWPEIIFFRQENQGSAVTRNRIIAEAKGEFIAFFDDDDKSLSQRVRKQYERILCYEAETGEEKVACYAAGIRRYPNGYDIDLNIVGTGAFAPHGTDMARNILFFQKTPGISYGGIPACALMAKKKVFLEIGGFDPQFRRIQDLDLGVRLAMSEGHFIGTRENLIIQYATSGTDKNPQRAYDAHLRLIEKNRDFLIAENRYHYTRRWAQMRHFHFSGQRLKCFVALSFIFMLYPKWGLSQFIQTGTRRLIHEIKMKQKFK